MDIKIDLKKKMKTVFVAQRTWTSYVCFISYSLSRFHLCISEKNYVKFTIKSKERRLWILHKL